MIEAVMGVDVSIPMTEIHPCRSTQQVRQAGHIVVTNPDMLHSGIPPHHTKMGQAV